MTSAGQIIETAYDLSLGLTLICATAAAALITIVVFLVVKR